MHTISPLLHEPDENYFFIADRRKLVCKKTIPWQIFNTSTPCSSVFLSGYFRAAGFSACIFGRGKLDNLMTVDDRLQSRWLGFSAMGRKDKKHTCAFSVESAVPPWAGFQARGLYGKNQ